MKHLARANSQAVEGLAPGQITFLHDDHSKLAGFLSHDNQKLLKIFEQKQA